MKHGTQMKIKCKAKTQENKDISGEHQVPTSSRKGATKNNLREKTQKILLSVLLLILCLGVVVLIRAVHLSPMM